MLAGCPDLVSAFQTQARRRPDRQAVSARDGELTYRQLDEYSTTLARRLATRGASSGSVIALCTGRTTWLVVGILAVLKAGGAYLPLDPEHPGDRLRDLVGLAGGSLAVTTSELLESVADRADLAALELIPADVRELREPGVGESSPAERGPGSLAYVLPTSGSTGEPKGVQIEDRNVLALIDALNDVVLDGLGGELRIALTAPYVFDASVQQIFMALLLGHTLVIMTEKERVDGAALRRRWAEERIDVADGTPAHLLMLAEAVGVPPVTVRRLLIGGDALTPEVLRRFYAQCATTATTVINVYGVAECCVDSTAGPADPESSAAGVTIGRELPGTSVLVLNEDLDPVADGELGELCVAGPGVGRGYLGRPALTAERFLDRPGGRLYRTGDLGRRLPDGSLQFAGRKDRQIKLRGHRIEPGEIEAALCHYTTAASASQDEVIPCERCLLTSAHPGVKVFEGVCSECRSFDRCRPAAEAYFGGSAEMMERIRRHSTRETSGYDVLLLFSGGKDSTYALYRLLDQGLRVFAFTFDNGFISPRAFENIRRITSDAGVELEIGSVPAMDQIFTESLRLDSTVCSGCFRGLTALSTRLAAERGIGVVATGLSRGQIYDTKLQLLFEAGVTDPEDVDRRLLEHRRIYHARRDRTSELLSAPVEEEMLDEILFLDYFRYDDIGSARIKQFLADRDPFWAEPSDTGMCSTNCKINDVGIFVHSLERGYHNYVKPLSWDCRLGVLQREEGLRELSDLVPRDRVIGTLRRLGYTPVSRLTPVSQSAVIAGRFGLTAYYTAPAEIDPRLLRAHVSAVLPDFMVPAHFVHLPAMPLTDTGKIDYAALPEVVVGGESDELPPTATERRIVAIWSDLLGMDLIRRSAEFFAMGGDSVKAIIFASIVQKDFQVTLSLNELFVVPTVEGCAEVIDAAVAATESSPVLP